MFFLLCGKFSVFVFGSYTREFWCCLHNWGWKYQQATAAIVVPPSDGRLFASTNFLILRRFLRFSFLSVCSRRHKLAQLSKSRFFLAVSLFRFVLIMRIYRQNVVHYTFIGLTKIGTRPWSYDAKMYSPSDHLIQIEMKIVCIQLERKFKICAHLFSNKTNVPLHLDARKSRHNVNVRLMEEVWKGWSCALRIAATTATITAACS